MTADTFVPVVTEVPRDRFGRPKVTPPEGGAPVSYTRCTTFVGALDDTYNLGKWQMRKTAEGLAAREDLLLGVNALGFEPDKLADPDGFSRWRSAMDVKCDEAVEAAKAHASATIGTALHALTERLDRGQDVGNVPAAYVPHLRAYEAATARFQVLHIEEFAVHDGLKIGGTPDRVIAIDGVPGALIGDLKTGTVEPAYLLKMCMQLSVYARSVLYDPGTGHRRPYLAEVNPDVGVIIALSAKTGLCELVWIDLAAGWEAVQVAAEVRRWRTRKNLQAGSLLPTLEPDANAALFAAIDAAPTAAELVELWRAAGPRWTVAHSTRASARKAQLA